MRKRSKPLLVYDGECLFCRRWISRWRDLTGDRIEYAPYQEAASEFPDIPIEKFRSSVQLVDKDGEVYEGAEGVFRAVATGRGEGVALWAYRNLPGFASLCELGYRWVARNRQGLSRVTQWLWGPHLERPTYALSRGLFLRILGAIYLVAFISLGPQLPGLIGEEGILPAASYLEAAGEQLGPERFWRLPTLAWLDSGETFFQGLWVGGAVLSVLVVLGVAPGAILFLLWILYLSLVTVGRDFLGFQWDNLLLETGFLAIFLAPWKLWLGLGRGKSPPRVPFWLLRWLLFRIMFSSGVVKLTSGDATWRELSALEVHYETQPLPTWVGWFAHQLPARCQEISVVLMFAVELVVPFLVFLPRRARILAFWSFSGLMALIALTGNYGFFNWLTFALGILLLDDQFLSRFFPRWKGIPGKQLPASKRSRWFQAAVGSVLLVIIFPVSLAKLGGAFRYRIDWPGPVRSLVQAVGPFRSVNGYGLFARMTTTRPEILVEGSQDGIEWHAYAFKWKPGDLQRRPAFVAPHMPRLDWQMWFAALSTYRRTPWFGGFVLRLLQGSPEVLALLEENPFPESPPRYVRAVVYRYRFTSWDERREEPAWWRREEMGLFLPPVSLKRQ